MKKIIFPLFVLLILPRLMPAQIGGYAMVEYGFSAEKYKGNELGVFLDAYNANNQQLGLTKPFDKKLSAATGDYWKAGITVGSAVQMMLDFAIYKNKTKPLQARFSDGSGRDISVGQRTSNTTVGIRVGGTDNIPLWVQYDMDVIIQNTTIYSAYIYPDGTPSMGHDHTLNGCYSDFILSGGTGVSFGIKYKYVGISAQADYLFNWGTKQPENHQYQDLNYLKENTNEPDYLPRDFSNYNNYSGSSNSISDDVHGWRFTVGFQIYIGKINGD